MGLWSKILGGGGDDGTGPSTERTAPNPERPAKASGPPPAPLEPKRHSMIVTRNGPAAAHMDEVRLRAALFVSHTSLTAEELASPSGRPSLPTLSGLGFDRNGAPIPQLSLGAKGAVAAPEGTDLATLSARVAQAAAGIVARSAPAALEAPRVSTPTISLQLPLAPEEITASVELLSDFAFRLALGPLSEEWMRAGAGAARSLLAASRAGWQPHLLASFEGLEVFLSRGARNRALPMLWRLSDSVPDWPPAARNLRDTARRRERRVVSELLASVDGLKARTRSRFAHEKTLTHLAAATPELLAAELETPIERARELVRLVASYEAARRASPIDLGHNSALRRAVLELARRQREFAARDEELREARQRRRHALTRVNLVLATRGDLQLLQELEPLAVAERVQRLLELVDVDPSELGEYAGTTGAEDAADPDAAALEAEGALTPRLGPGAGDAVEEDDEAVELDSRDLEERR